MKISIVMTTYCGEKYILEQLNSLKEQSLTPDEIIIVDDKSKDNTPAIIKDFIEKNGLTSWKFFENSENLGFKKNFLYALKKATGDIVFLCDQDDVWEREKIKKAASFFEKDKVFGVMTGFTYIDGAGDAKNDSNTCCGIYGFLRKKPKKVFSKISLKSIMHKNISPGCTCAFRKEVLEICLKNAKDNLAHDYQLCAVSAALGGLYFFNFPLTKYRIHKNNTLGLNDLSQTRLEIAKEKADLSSVYFDINDKIKGVSNMYFKRYKVIENKKGFLSLLLDKNYVKYYSSKEVLGDLIYILR